MRQRRVSVGVLMGLWVLACHAVVAQCPQFPTASITGNIDPLCEGSSITLSITGQDIAPGSNVEWYINPGSTFNPYNGEGTLIGSVPVMSDPCNNPPQVLYIMVNPDNVQAGGSGDQCDEFMVIWTGSGGFMTSDIEVSNLGPGTFVWDDFVAGTASSFNCGIPLPPGPVPANAILIIQSSTSNNVFIDSDNLCASGLPVYIIAFNGTSACTGGYFDNNSPCASCPVIIDINGATCQFDVSIDYMPPGSSIDGWGWSNNGSGVFADVVPVVDIPPFIPSGVIINDFVWTVPANFCETMGGGNYWITGILNPEPGPGCTEIFTSFFGLEISCPEMILSGGGDVCEGNCPDNPTEINFTIVGNDVPFTADIIVTASVFPPFPISDLEITNGQSITVCLEGFFPSFNPVTGILTVPILAIGITATVQVVSLTSASGCPVLINPNSLTLNFIGAPSVNAGNNQSICAGDVVSLSGSIGGSATESEWFTNGDGTFDDPTSLDAIYTPGPGDITSGEVTLTLTSTDANGACVPAESTITITIEPSLIIEVNTPLTICDNDVANIVAMVTGSTEPCNWETTGDGSFDDPFSTSTIYTPGSIDIANGSVTLLFVPVDPGACVESSEPLVLTIAEAPDVDLPQNLEICEDDSVVVIIDIDGAFTNVTWMAPGDGILVIDNDMQVTYTPGPIDISNQFFIVSVTVQSVFPECGQTTYNIPVDIIFCDCPPFSTSPPAGALCSINDMLDLSSLLTEGGSGSWSITAEPPGINPATMIGSLFSTAMSDAGPYTVTYTLDNPEAGCPASSSEVIIVASLVLPFAGPDATFCGPQSVILNGEVSPSINVPILWETLGDGSFTDNTSLNTTYIPGPVDSLSAGFYLVLNVLDAICGNQSDTVSLFFNAAPFALFTTDTATICNDEDNGSVLNFFSLITSGDLSGTWTNISGVPVDFSNPSSVNFDGIAEGYYPFEYVTNSAMSPCTEANYTIIVAVETCLCPLLIVQNVPGGICNSQPDLPLNAFIQAGAPGSWQVISTPAGSNPGTVVGSTLIINGCDPGVYGLRFTFDAAPIVACPDSAEIEILIQEVSSLSISGVNSSCGLTGIQVNGIIGGSAIGLFWTSSGLGMFNDPGSLNPVYTPSSTDVASAQVSLYAVTVDTLGFCPVLQDTIHIILVTPPSTTFSQLTDTLCNLSDSGSVINLFSFIVSGDGTGFWTDLDGSQVDLTDPSQVNFDGVPPGNYRLLYTTQTAVAPCTDSMYTFTVVVEDCACPPLEIATGILSLCQGASADLNDQVVNAAPGAWSIVSGPSGIWPVITGTVISTTDAAGGNYTLVYSLTDSIPGCPASDNFSLAVETAPSFIVLDLICDADHLFYEIVIETGADFISSDFGNVTMQGAGSFTISAIPAGQNVQILATSGAGLCVWVFDIASPDCNCTLFTEDITDTIRVCLGDTFVLIPIVTGAQGLPFSTWVTPYGTKMQPTLPLYEEGEYIWIVRDQAGCEERDTFFVDATELLVTEYTTVPPACPGNADGQLIIEVIEDLTSPNATSPPYTIQLDSGTILVANQLPFTINNVSLGQHMIMITDIMGCSNTLPVTMSGAQYGSVDLGPDVTIQKGDSVLIRPMVEDIAISDVSWNPSFPGMGIEDFWYAPEITTLVSLVVQDSAGCLYEDELLITVFEKETFYIPTVFSPNGDQINDGIEVHTNIPPDNLISFEIFDRWGSLLYGQYAAPPFQWDGTTEGKEAQSGVYVYKLVWNNQDGNTKAKFGDITVIR